MVRLVILLFSIFFISNSKAAQCEDPNFKKFSDLIQASLNGQVQYYNDLVIFVDDQSTIEMSTECLTEIKSLAEKMEIPVRGFRETSAQNVRLTCMTGCKPIPGGKFISCSPSSCNLGGKNKIQARYWDSQQKEKVPAATRPSQ